MVDARAGSGRTALPRVEVAPRTLCQASRVRLETAVKACSAALRLTARASCKSAMHGCRACGGRQGSAHKTSNFARKLDAAKLGRWDKHPTRVHESQNDAFTPCTSHLYRCPTLTSSPPAP
eukprot:2813847-Prymnesium_polylepis.1